MKRMLALLAACAWMLLASSALAVDGYEYTYTYRGTQYHTYQVMIVHEKIPLLLQKGYVFTFTAPEAVYAAELASVMKMIGKVTF